MPYIKDMLLTRQQFKAEVFKRDNYLCVNCPSKAVDAHHLIERKLWPDGGYYADNGVSLCSSCHLLAEETTLSVEELREKAQIKTVMVPPGFISGVLIDKWGNELRLDGTRSVGPLMEDTGCQKALRRYRNIIY